MIWADLIQSNFYQEIMTYEVFYGTGPRDQIISNTICLFKHSRILFFQLCQ